ncbi:hypothetical protein NMY22_g2290 [Coprinellus aureogranulatus]|nr:hypothetical protein NMY22_g2290 [Coprinellus aureogranulatus]
MSTKITVKLGVHPPSVFLPSIHHASINSLSEDSPLSLEVVKGGNNPRALALGERETVRSILRALNEDLDRIQNIYIHTGKRSSLPHPATLLYPREQGILRSLRLTYIVDDGNGTERDNYPPTMGRSRQTFYPTLKALTLDGHILLSLLELDQALNLLIPLGNLNALSVLKLSDCATRLTANHIITLFDVLLSLTKLEFVRMDELDIPHRLHPLLPPPASRSHTPITLKHFIAFRTSGFSLTYLLRRFQPKVLTLDGCYFIDFIPCCTRLTLNHIPDSNTLLDVLEKWDGAYMVIGSSPFFNNTFLQRLEHLVRSRQEPLWKHLTHIDIQDCGQFNHTLLLRVLEVRSHTLGYQPTPSWEEPAEDRDLVKWANELGERGITFTIV